MTDVQFSEEAVLPTAIGGKSKGSMAGWLVRTGWVKNEKQAEYALVGIAVVAFATMTIVLMSGSFGSPEVPPNPLEQAGVPGPGAQPTGNAR